MRKKEKLEKSILKMLGDSPEGIKLRDEIRQRESRRKKIKGKIKNFCHFCVVCFLGLLGISVVLSMILCPLIFYTDTQVSFTISNVSDAEYAYILNGNPSMHLKYYGETRALNSSDIKFYILISDCWNHAEKAEIWTAQGNISYLGMNED